MILRSLLNGGAVEIGDNDAESLLASGHWVRDGEAPAKKPRATRTKKAPVEEPESEE